MVCCERGWKDGAVVGAVCCVLLAGCSGKGGEHDAASGASRKPPVAVEAVTVTAGILDRTVSASGTVLGRNEATVVSETDGVITQSSFELGERVRSGAVLVRVDDRIRKSAMESALQQYETARTNLDAARKLESTGGTARAEVNRLDAVASAARVAYEAAQKAWEDCTVRAPIDGYVASKDGAVTKGNYLSRGVRVAHVVDLSVLRVSIGVGEREVGQVREGAAARVSVAAPCTPNEFDAVVKAVAAGADPGSGSFAVVVEWKNTCGTGIKSGMTATVTIPSAGQDTVVVVPSAALVVRDGRDAVLVAAGDRTVVRPVRKGRVAGNRTHIVDGVQAGEVVIMSALGSLGPNDPVTVTLVGRSGTWQ